VRERVRGRLWRRGCRRRSSGRVEWSVLRALIFFE
jgi:hypothetical protein